MAKNVKMNAIFKNLLTSVDELMKCQKNKCLPEMNASIAYNKKILESKNIKKSQNASKAIPNINLLKCSVAKCNKAQANGLDNLNKMACYIGKPKILKKTGFKCPPKPLKQPVTVKVAQEIGKKLINLRKNSKK